MIPTVMRLAHHAVTVTVGWVTTGAALESVRGKRIGTHRQPAQPSSVAQHECQDGCPAAGAGHPATYAGDTDSTATVGVAPC